MNKKFISAVTIAAAASLLFTSCGALSEATPTRNDQLKEQNAKSESRRAPNVTGDAEYNNYIKAQEEVYDNPASIIWCTAYPENPSAPIFTVPIAGKLTSSSVSFFPSTSPKKWGAAAENGYLQENRSVDGMYHGSPGPYRYGFTPSGQYVDFTNIPTFCSTHLTEFQRQTIKVATVATEDEATEKINDLLEKGETEKAQKLADSLGE